MHDKRHFDVILRMQDGLLIIWKHRQGRKMRSTPSYGARFKQSAMLIFLIHTNHV